MIDWFNQLIGVYGNSLWFIDDSFVRLKFYLTDLNPTLNCDSKNPSKDDEHGCICYNCKISTEPMDRMQRIYHL